MKAIIVGGSIAGLMAAMVLQSIGYEVLILEKSPVLYMDRGNAGIHLGVYAQKFFQHHMPRGEAEYAEGRSTILDGRISKSDVVVDINSGVVYPLAHSTDQVWTTDWNVVYRALLQTLQTSTGSATIQIGTKVIDAYLMKDGRWNVISEGREDEQADLLIGADGAYSTMRSLVLPSLEPQYDGYLAWQGRFSAKDIPTQIEKVLDGELLWMKMANQYIILYAIRDEDDVSVEWRWYHPYDESSLLLKDIMTDIHSLKHREIVTPDILQPHVWQEQLDRAVKDIPPWMEPLLRQCKTPLVTKVTYFDNTRSSFYGGKLLLVGEAFCQIRPHLGASAALAAMQATWMGDMLKSKRFGPQHWERQISQYAAKKGERSRKFGCFGMQSM